MVGTEQHRREEEETRDMSGREPDLAALRRELAGIASEPSTVHETAHAALELLGRIVPFDAAWLAFRDPERRWHAPLATAGPAEALRRYFLTPEADLEVEQLGLNRTGVATPCPYRACPRTACSFATPGS
jgi:hypothetical protein